MASPASAHGSGGSAPAVAMAAVTLNNAQIKALDTTPRQLVAAPGAGSMILPTLAFASFDWTADYTNIAATCRLAVTHLASHSFALLAWLDQSILGAEVDRLLGSGDSETAFFGPLGIREPGAARGYTYAYPPGESPSFYDDAALNLVMENGAAGNLTGGDAANSLTVTVLYATIDL